MRSETGLLTCALLPDRLPGNSPSGYRSGVLHCASIYQTRKCALTVAGQWRFFTAFPNISCVDRDVDHGQAQEISLALPWKALFPSCAGIVDYSGIETSLSNTRLYDERSKLPEKKLKFARVTISVIIHSSLL